LDIRTKLVFTLVAVALASMVGLAYTAYGTVAQQARAARLTQLSGLAEFKVGSLEGILEGWYDRLSLVATRQRLRGAMVDHLESPEEADVARLGTLLRGVRRASPVFHQVSVHGPGGEIIAVAGPEPPHGPADLGGSVADRNEPWFLGVIFPAEGELPLASLATPLDLDGRRVGYLHAYMSTDEILQISSNYDGLGETGETMVVTLQGDEGRILHPVRAAPVPGDSTLEADRFRAAGLRVVEGGPTAMSLLEGERRLAGDVTDYRGQQVWAATDYLADPGWGVVVKGDAAGFMNRVALSMQPARPAKPAPQATEGEAEAKRGPRSPFDRLAGLLRKP